jgi:hypothetical protein
MEVRLNWGHVLVGRQPLAWPGQHRNIPTAFWMIPSSPCSYLPSVRPAKIAENKPSLREVNEPASDQNVPFGQGVTQQRGLDALLVTSQNKGPHGVNGSFD